MSIENDFKCLSLLFYEVNNHLRNTENKYITISLSYFGFVSVTSSIAFQIITKDVNDIIVHVLLVLIGTSVIMLQKWYCFWKEHYLQTSKRIYSKILSVNKIKIEEELKPYWLRKKKRASKFNADYTLLFFTNIVNFGVVLKLCYELFSSNNNGSILIRFVVPISIAVVYLLFITLMPPKPSNN